MESFPFIVNGIPNISPVLVITELFIIIKVLPFFILRNSFGTHNICMCIIMLLKRSTNLRNHWHLKERWRRNWNICIMFYCIFQVKGNCTITSLGRKKKLSEGVHGGKYVNLNLSLSNKDNELQTGGRFGLWCSRGSQLMKHPEEFLYHGAGVQELTLMWTTAWKRWQACCPSTF